MSEFISVEELKDRIYRIRGRQVMFASDLADIYGVPTKALNQAVKRNRGRFPTDFVFQLNKAEVDIWRSQFGVG